MPEGLRASFVVELVERIASVPPATQLLHELVAAGLVAAAPAPVTMGSRLRLTERGEAALAEATSAGAWLPREGPPRWRSPLAPTAPGDLGADERAFTEVGEVLDGRRRFRLDGASAKMLRLILGGADTDTVITPERFVVHFGPQKQRLPSRYFRHLAPRVMSELLERAALDAVSGPVVIGLPGGDVPMVSDFPRWSYESKLLWIVAAGDVVRLSVRRSREAWREPFAQAVPPEGPLALLELPEWTPTPPAYREFAMPLTCTRCGLESTHYRRLRDALVCLRCGRSFAFAD